MSARIGFRTASKALALAAALALLAATVQAGEPVEIEGSAWDTSGALRAKLDSVKEDLVADGLLEFGPGNGLLENEFRLTLDDGEAPFELLGTYEEPKPGKLSFDFVDDELADALGLIGELEGLGLKLKTKLKAKAKSKDGVETMRLKLKLAAKLSLGGFDTPFGSDSLGVKLGYKGEGTRVTLE